MHASENVDPTLPDLVENSGQVVPAENAGQPSSEYIQWLEARSMLHHAEHLADLVTGKSTMYRNAFGHPRPKDFIRSGSVWFTSYPKSIITRPGHSVLQTLGDEALLSAFREIGIEGIHLGPMKRAGGITGLNYTPTTDGFFDRIELSIDPLFGTEAQYLEMTHAARGSNVIVIGDLVPAHSGKGADFRLAERAFKNYEGLYTMVEIPEEDWRLLPPVPEGADCVNLSKETAQLLEDKTYIPGPAEIVPFYDPGIKDTNWSATDVITGVDGQRRRWVYLHVFKAGQPSFNWLDPTFGAQRIIMADAVQSLFVWGDKGLRLDASPLMGIEGRPGVAPSWIGGHPVSVGGSNAIAMMIRKLGGYSFQELNLELDALKEFTRWGPELSYDFFTRSAYFCAMATGDAGPLRLMLSLIQQEGLDLGIFVHSLQNHDELMFGLSHMVEHAQEKFLVNGQEMLGKEIYESIYQRTKEKVMGRPDSPVCEFSILGFCSTLTTFTIEAIGARDPYNPSPAEKEQVQKLHLLAAAFNAMQPGVFAISGWDLVGSLSVPPEALGDLLDDGDCRWLNRGAFDLMGVNHGATTSAADLPRAAAAYGTLPDQLNDSNSFVSELKRMLQARKEYGIALSTLVLLPEVINHGIVVMLFRREEDAGWVLTALNFGREPVHETILLPQLCGKAARMIYSIYRAVAKSVQISSEGGFSLDLGPMQCEVFVVE